MIIMLTAGSAPQLQDPLNFSAFKVVTSAPLKKGALAKALGTAGRADGETAAFIDQAWLRAQIPDDEPGWLGKLDGMIAYAGTKGWLAEDGAIRAHVETA